MLLPQLTSGAEFFIEFDILAGHSPSTGAVLSSLVLQSHGWASIGEKEGGRFVNKTGKTVRAIHLKSNVASYTFKVTADSGGRLFPEIWVKDDGSEAWFLGGNVPRLGAFWMRVPANTQNESVRCRDQRVCPFSGQVFEVSPPGPTEPGWTKIRTAPESPSELWKQLIDATPSEYREIQSYGESPDGRYILFVATGQILLFDSHTKSVALVPSYDSTLLPVNRIAVDGGDFVLMQSGKIVRRVSPSMVERMELEIAPKE
jgi:hypothetical protein